VTYSWLKEDTTDNCNLN